MVATEYRERETSLKQSQHMLWYAKQQDAVRLRERHSTEIANLTAGFEALQADLRAAENRLETLRAEHFKAGDALHERQGAFYAANAEVTRLEQQLEFARERKTAVAAGRADHRTDRRLTAQLGAIASDAQAGEREVEAALARREAAEKRTRRHGGCRRSRSRCRCVARARRSSSETEIEQSIQLAATRRESAAKLLAALHRRERLDAETRELAAPVNDQIALVTDQLAQEAPTGRPRGEPRRTERRRAGAAGSASRGWRRMANHEQRAGRA
jgi:chromosome segregation protein